MITRFLTILFILLSNAALAHADPAKEAALTRYIAVMKAEDSYNAVAREAMSPFFPLVQMNAAKQKEAAEIIQSTMVPLLKAEQPQFNKVVRAAYDKHFTTAELGQITDFLTSPVGMKMRATEQEIGPDVMHAIGPDMNAVVNKAAPLILAKMKAAGMRVPLPSKNAAKTNAAKIK